MIGGLGPGGGGDALRLARQCHGRQCPRHGVQNCLIAAAPTVTVARARVSCPRLAAAGRGEYPHDHQVDSVVEVQLEVTVTVARGFN